MTKDIEKRIYKAFYDGYSVVYLAASYMITERKIEDVIRKAGKENQNQFNAECAKIDSELVIGVGV